MKNSINKNNIALVIDTETTGLLKPLLADNLIQPHITEIHLIAFDLKKFKSTREFSTLIRSVDKKGNQIPLPEHITKITNIDDAMLKKARTFNEICKSLTNFCRGIDTIIGHNLMFDYEILRQAYIRIGKENKLPKFKNKFCTVEMSYPIKNKRLKLLDLHYMVTGQPIEDQHRAEADCLATMRCFKWLLKNGF